MIEAQLATLPFSHIRSNILPVRVVDWLRAAAVAGLPLPLGLAYDLGLLLSQPADTLQFGRATYLPVEMETANYLAFLQRMALYPLVQALARGQPTLNDTLLGVIIARLVQGLDLPALYRIPTGVKGAYFAHDLRQRLDSYDHDDQVQLWQETAPEKRVAWHELLPAEALAQVEHNLRTLKHDELRFMVRYGSPLAGSPDPRELLDLLALTNLPPAVGLALSQSLQLLPRLSELRVFGGVQRYPTGGYEGLTRKGNLDNLLPSELAYPQDIFLHRVLNNEALYYGRERPRTKERALAYIVVQSGLGLGEDGRLMARALLLALSELLTGRGYEVQYSFAGSSLSRPATLRTHSDMFHLLYYRDKGLPKVKESLQDILHYLTSIHNRYTVRHLLWVVSDHFDMDDSVQHAPLYQALQAVAQQSAWYIHQGTSPYRANGNLREPPTARHVGFWQIIDTALIWRESSPPPATEHFLSRSVSVWERYRSKIEQYGFRDGVRDALHFIHDAQFEAWHELASIEDEPKVNDYLRALAPPDMVYIPAGPFLMGSADDDPDAQENEKPQHEVWLHGYYIGRYPITNVKYLAFMEAGGYQAQEYWTEAGWEEKERYNWEKNRLWKDERFNYPNQPVVGISWYEALAYARWAGKTLPSEAQWEKAASWNPRIKKKRKYSWGDGWEMGRCHTQELWPNGTAEVGTYAQDQSFYGISDLAGNVNEWCLTQRDTFYPYSSDDGRENIDEKKPRCLRGGSWNDKGKGKWSRCAFRAGFDPQTWGIDRGFRCVWH